MLVVVIALLATAVILWWNQRRIHQEEVSEAAAECIAGNLAVPVAGSDGVDVGAILEPYNNTSPLVRDHCVQLVYTEDLSEAAAYIAPLSPATERTISAAGRAVEGTPPSESVMAEQAGIATLAGAETPTDPTAVDYSLTGNPDASIAVAMALNDGDSEAALQALTTVIDDATATVATAGAVPEGTSFQPVENAWVPYAIWPLAPSSATSESEEQTRAAAAFAAFTDDLSHLSDDGNEFSTAYTDSTLNDLYEKLGLTPQSVTATATTPSDTGGTSDLVATDRDTLILLDTSEATTAYASAYAHSLAELAEQIDAEGHTVALWNYSSPLNPGVVKPWRDNVSFGAASPVVEAVSLFGTGGVPMTRTSTVAAAHYAASHALETGNPTRLVVVTSGTDSSDISDDEFRTQLADAIGTADLDISVVTIGTGPQDETLVGTSPAHVAVLP